MFSLSFFRFMLKVHGGCNGLRDVFFVLFEVFAAHAILFLRSGGRIPSRRRALYHWFLRSGVGVCVCVGMRLFLVYDVFPARF